jgi:hypothetical protein
VNDGLGAFLQPPGEGFAGEQRQVDARRRLRHVEFVEHTQCKEERSELKNGEEQTKRTQLAAITERQ